MRFAAAVRGRERRGERAREQPGGDRPGAKQQGASEPEGVLGVVVGVLDVGQRRRQAEESHRLTTRREHPKLADDGDGAIDRFAALGRVVGVRQQA